MCGTVASSFTVGLVIGVNRNKVAVGEPVAGEKPRSNGGVSQFESGTNNVKTYKRYSVAPSQPSAVAV